MGLKNNMPPFSLSAHHFVQKGERLLILDHTLMDVLVIQIPFLFIPSTLLYYSSSLLCYFLLSHHFIHSFISLSRQSYQVSNGVFTFSSCHSLSFFHFPFFLCSSLFLRSMLLIFIAEHYYSRFGYVCLISIFFNIIHFMFYIRNFLFKFKQRNSSCIFLTMKSR